MIYQRLRYSIGIVTTWFERGAAYVSRAYTPPLAVAWQVHVSGAIREAVCRPDRVLFVRYEDLLKNTFKELYRICEFCDIIHYQDLISHVIETCSLSNLQDIESRHGPQIGAPEVEFFRCGRSRQWPSYFSLEELRTVECICGPTADQCGFELSDSRGA